MHRAAESLPVAEKRGAVNASIALEMSLVVVFYDMENTYYVCMWRSHIWILSLNISDSSESAYKQMVNDFAIFLFAVFRSNRDYADMLYSFTSHLWPGSSKMLPLNNIHSILFQKTEILTLWEFIWTSDPKIPASQKECSCSNNYPVWQTLPLYNFAFLKLIYNIIRPHIKRRMKIHCCWEQGAEESTWFQERQSNRNLGKTA
jgi:hypothetical protein